MNAIEKMRKAFDDCTVMAGVENKFECVYITKSAALSSLAEIEEENAKLRELLRDAWGNGHPDKSCADCEIRDECHAEIEEAYKEGNGRWNIRCLFERRIEDRMRELGVEVDE